MNIAKDKKKHLHYGGIISSLVALIFSVCGFQILQGCLIGLGVGVLVGVGKEVFWDKLLGKGNPEVMDAVYTGVGSFAYTLVLYIFLVILT